MRRLIVLIALLASGPSWAQAATYYVSTTGNNANAGSLASPWRNICYATGGGGYTWTSSPADRVACATTNPSKLAAGDTLQIRGGTYQENVITFANSGTAGNPITITRYAAEVPVVDAGYTDSAGRDPVWWLNGTNYITIERTTSRRGSQSIIYISYSVVTTNIIIQDNILQDVVTGDNTASIYADTGFDYLTIRRNTIHGKIVGASYGLTTGAGMTFFTGKRLTITNNEIYGIGTTSGLLQCMYYKHNSDNTDYDVVVKDNYCHDTGGRGIRWSSAYTDISNNLIVRAGTGIQIFEESAVCSSLWSGNNTITHNTIIAGTSGISLDRSLGCPGATNTLVRNNLVKGFTATDTRGFFIYPYYPDKWAASTAYGLTETAGGNTISTWRRTKDTNNGRKYKVTTAGTTAATEPTATCWTASSPTPGCTVTDGTVVWTEDGSLDVSTTTSEYNLVYSTVCTLCMPVGPLNYAIDAPPSTVLGTAATNLKTAPVFVNEASDNYTLTAASPGYLAASDGKDMGARICAVGITPKCEFTRRLPSRAGGFRQ